jgi:hypothetical protein
MGWNPMISHDDVNRSLHHINHIVRIPSHPLLQVVGWGLQLSIERPLDARLVNSLFFMVLVSLR